MNAVIDRPTTTRKPRAQKSEAPAQPALTEADTLTMKAASVIAQALEHIVCGPASTDSPGLREASDADGHFCAIAHWDDPSYRDNPTDTIQELLVSARQNLIAAHKKVCSSHHECPGWGLVHVAVLEIAFERTQRLMDAYAGLPGTLDDLRELAMDNGADLFRGPLRTAPAASPAPLVIERNEPGQLQFESRDELKKFALTNAHVLSSLNVCLSEVVNSMVDAGFVGIFAQHVSDLAWVQETATDLLLGGPEQ